MKKESEDALLFKQIDPARLPAHVAIIMDGNGRWAAQRNLPRVAGHRAGAIAVRAATETAARLGIRYLTLFAFSTENWNRPRMEVEALFRLLKEFLHKELKTLQKNDIRFRMLGRATGLELSVLKEIRKAERATEKNTGLLLNIALNYGGRAEIADACRAIAEDVAAGRLRPEQVDESTIFSRLYNRDLPDVDLLIRTSGEMRISNFLLWQLAYSEIYVTPTLWPDFRGKDLLTAVIEYQKRDRRYGRVKHDQRGILAL